jgi:hypothetical protein
LQGISFCFTLSTRKNRTPILAKVSRRCYGEQFPSFTDGNSSFSKMERLLLLSQAMKESYVEIILQQAREKFAYLQFCIQLL